MSTTILEHEGFQVIQARDGYQGLEATKQAKPALIVLNILLPGMMGYVVVQALRQRPEFTPIPILAVITIPLLGNRARALESGCTDYIEKPITPTLFIDKVKAHLQPELAEIPTEHL